MPKVRYVDTGSMERRRKFVVGAVVVVVAVAAVAAVVFVVSPDAEQATSEVVASATSSTSAVSSTSTSQSMVPATSDGHDQNDEASTTTSGLPSAPTTEPPSTTTTASTSVPSRERSSTVVDSGSGLVVTVWIESDRFAREDGVPMVRLILENPTSEEVWYWVECGCPPAVSLVGEDGSEAWSNRHGGAHTAAVESHAVPAGQQLVFEKSCGSCRIEPGAYLLKAAVAVCAEPPPAGHGACRDVTAEVSPRLEVLVTADRG